ncbi:MAG: hypothetical protein ABJO54_03360 [Hyphomicrobiales bacterium]
MIANERQPNSKNAAQLTASSSDNTPTMQTLQLRDAASCFEETAALPQQT